MTNTQPLELVVQKWEESERGWGVRPDGYSLHLTEPDRAEYIKSYWDRMPKAAPSEYTRPSGNPYQAKVSDLTEEELTALHVEHGIRRRDNNYPSDGAGGVMDSTKPPSREPAPVTDAEAEACRVDYEGVAEDDLFEQDKLLLRLIADRARDQERIASAERLLGLEVLAREAAQERIRELEKALEARSRSIHSKFVQERRHDRSWQGCYNHPCKDDRALLEVHDAE